jgi:Protein of unknown function (DUF3311)
MRGNKAVLGLLLLIPFVVNLLVPLYNIADPMEFGLPFFWWFQIILLPLSAVLYLIFAAMAGDEP